MKKILLIILMLTNCSTFNHIAAIYVPMENNEACPNLGNLKNIPDNKILMNNEKPSINVKPYNKGKLNQVIPLEIAQNSVENIKTHKEYQYFITNYYSQVCEGYPPYRSEIKYYRDLKEKLDKLQTENQDLINLRKEKVEKRLKLQDERVALQRIVYIEPELFPTFTLTGKIDTKTEKELFIYGLAVSNNGEAFTKGAILQNEFYVVSRKNIEVNPLYFLLEKMYFHGEVKVPLKNGNIVMINSYASYPPEAKLSPEIKKRRDEEKKEYEATQVKLKEVSKKEEDVMNEIKEIDLQLKPMKDLEYSYTHN